MKNLVDYPLPDWISIAFLMVIFIPSVLIAFLAKKGLNNSNKAFFIVISFFTIYFSYVSFASLNGLFDKVFLDRKSTRLNSSHALTSRMTSSA